MTPAQDRSKLTSRPEHSRGKAMFRRVPAAIATLAFAWLFNAAAAWAVAITCAGIPCPTPATLPAPSGIETLQLPDGSTVTQTGIGLPITQSSLLFGYTAAASITPLPSPVLSTNGATLGFASPLTATAALTYFVSVVPLVPAAAAPKVMLDATATLSGQALGFPILGSASSDAKITISDPMDGFTDSKDNCANIDGTCGGCPSGIFGVCVTSTSYLFNRFVTVGAPIEVDLSSISSITSTFLSSQVNSLVDPFFFIDPSFPDADLYSVIVNPEIGNSPPTGPGPSAVAEPNSIVVLGSFLIFLALYLLWARSSFSTSKEPLQQLLFHLRA